MGTVCASACVSFFSSERKLKQHHRNIISFNEGVLLNLLSAVLGVGGESVKFVFNNLF